MADKIDQLEIEISASSVEAAKQVNELADAMNRLKKSLGGTWKNPIPKATGSSAASSAQSIQPQDAAGVAKEADEARGKVTRLVEEKGKLKQSTKLRIDSKDADKANSKLASLWASIKRIAFYRAIRSALKAVGEAFKVGLENAYEYSRLVGGELAPALDRIATAAAQAKNQLGAAWGQALQMLEPIIVQLLHLVTKLAQGFTWLFAVLSGSDTYLVANEVATSWKEADKAAKAYRKTLLGIDEINQLNDPSSGGGKTTPDYASMFHEEPTGYKLPDLSAWALPLMDWLNKIGDGLDDILDKLKEFNQNPFGFLIDGLNGLYNTLLKIPPSCDGGAAAIDNLVEKIKKIPQSKTINIKFNMGDAVPQIEELLRKISAYSPITIGVGFKIESPLDELQRLYDAVMAYTPMVLEIKCKIFDTAKIQKAIEDFARAVALAMAAVGIASVAMSFVYDGSVAAMAAVTALKCAEMTGSYAAMQLAVSDSMLAIEGSAKSMQKAIEGAVFGSVKALQGYSADAVYYFGIFDGAVGDATQAVDTFGSACDYNAGKVRNFINELNRLNGVTVKIPSLPASSSSGGFGSTGGFGGGSRGRASSGALGAVASGIESAFEAVADGLEDIVKATKNGVRALPFASGGFPEDGLFFANHGELVGKFANGRTAVANNEQIVDGISEGVRDANTELLTAVLSGFSQVITAIRDNGGNGGSIDLDMLASALYRPMQRQNTIHGESLVSYTR